MTLLTKLIPGDNFHGWYLGWSPTNPRMVTVGHPLVEAYYKLEIWHLDLTHKTNTR